MVFKWLKQRNWEDEYDNYYSRDHDHRKPVSQQVRYGLHLIGLGVALAVFIAAAGIIGGQVMLEKIVTSLLLPCGLIWLALMVMIYFCLLQRQAWPAMIGLFCWVALTAFGNRYVAHQLVDRLERKYQDIDTTAGPPYDLVFVLGGGTFTSSNYQTQLNSAGDRVLTAAEMYHAGQVKQIICTGEQAFRSTEQDLHPYQEAMNILVALQVPQQVIGRLPAINTSSEMQRIAEYIQQENLSGSRIGLITSAWHMNRAMRLASSHDLNLEPIPCDFVAEPFRPHPNLIIPSPEYLMISGWTIKEYLAGLIGR